MNDTVANMLAYAPRNECMQDYRLGETLQSIPKVHTDAVTDGSGRLRRTDLALLTCAVATERRKGSDGQMSRF